MEAKFEEERRCRMEIEAKLEQERKLREEQSVMLQSMVTWMQGLGIKHETKLQAISKCRYQTFGGKETRIPQLPE